MKRRQKAAEAGSSARPCRCRE